MGRDVLAGRVRLRPVLGRAARDREVPRLRCHRTRRIVGPRLRPQATPIQEQTGPLTFRRLVDRQRKQDQRDHRGGRSSTTTTQARRSATSHPGSARRAARAPGPQPPRRSTGRRRAPARSRFAPPRAALSSGCAEHLRTHKSLKKLLLARLRRPCAIDQHRIPPAGNVRPTLLSALWSRITQMASFQPWCRSPLLNSCERRCGVMTDASEVRETRDLERRNHELSVLNEIARELNRSVELGEALGFTLSQVAELLGLRTAWIWLIDDSSPEPYLAAARNLPPALADDPRRMDGSGYCYCLDTYKRGDLEGAANVNVLTCSRLDGLVDGTGGLRYHASIPLYAGEKKLGVMNVASPQWRGLSSEDLQLLSTIGDLLAIAVERARLYDRSARFGAVEERNRLAREIHDTLAQGLTATGLQLESAEALLDHEAGG